MIEWLREHKLPAIMGAIVAVLVISFYLFSDSTNRLETQNIDEWMAADEQEMNSKNESDQSNLPEDEEPPAIMLADIKGAVVNPGVYEIFENERILNLIEKAGGLTKEADTASVNFALKVSDEMAVYIPRKGEELPSELGAMNSEGETGSGKGKKVNLNTATTGELETLPGIGPSKSTAIIEFRENEGPFKTIEDLKQISGIGEKTFEKLKDSIIVK